MSGSSPALPSEGDPLYHDGVSYYTPRNFVFVEGFDAVFVEGFGVVFVEGFGVEVKHSTSVGWTVDAKVMSSIPM